MKYSLKINCALKECIREPDWNKMAKKKIGENCKNHNRSGHRWGVCSAEAKRKTGRVRIEDVSAWIKRSVPLLGKKKKKHSTAVMPLPHAVHLCLLGSRSHFLCLAPPGRMWKDKVVSLTVVCRLAGLAAGYGGSLYLNRYPAKIISKPDCQSVAV